MIDTLDRKLELIANLREHMKNIDWHLHNQRVVWNLNEPSCCCTSCYDSWFEWGKGLYVGNITRYEEKKKLALTHLENKLNSQKLNEAKKANQKEERYFCSAS
jgi:hypothetical protein